MRYRSHKLLLIAVFAATAAGWTPGTRAATDRIRLVVPVARQDASSVCGPASLEMLFRYYGETRFDQFQIAYDIATRFRGEPRFRDSDYLTAKGVRWLKYPGTPAYVLFRYLKTLGTVDYHYREHAPPPAEREAARRAAWARVVEHLSAKRPVLIMQYWKAGGQSTHYRVITGFENGGARVFLNDPRYGSITQSREEFFRLWEIDERNLTYTTLALTPTETPLRVRVAGTLPKQYEGILYASDLEEFYTGQNQYFKFSHSKGEYYALQLKPQRWDYRRVGFSFEAYERLQIELEVRLDPARIDKPDALGFCGLILGDKRGQNFNVYGVAHDGRAAHWTRRAGSWQTESMTELRGPQVGQTFARLQVSLSPSGWEFSINQKRIPLAKAEQSAPDGLAKVGVFCKNSGAWFRELRIRRG